MTASDNNAPLTRLEDEVVARLKGEGLIADAGAGAGLGSRRWLGAAVLVAFIGVALVGFITLRPDRDAAQGDLYVLALYTTESYRSPRSEDRRRAQEYGEWARAHSRGPAAVVGGEELLPPMATLGTAPASADELVGFFTVRARSRPDVVALAKTTPHLRYGGAVSIRPAST